MDALQAIVLGIVQGLTEFLPISSSGHLRIVPAFFGWEDPGTAFTAVCQIGTMLAVLLFFREDLWRIARTWVASLRDPALRADIDARMGWYIILGTIPISIVGLLFSNQIEDGGRDLYLIGSALIVFSFVMLAAERFATQERELPALTRRDGIIIGLAQAIALIPGISRSGSTISAGLFLGLARPAAARYSFLLSIPAVVLSGLFELRHIGDGDGAGAGATIIAVVLAFIVGYASIAFLLKFLVKNSISVFVLYRLVVGVAVLVLASTGAIS